MQPFILRSRVPLWKTAPKVLPSRASDLGFDPSDGMAMRVGANDSNPDRSKHRRCDGLGLSRASLGGLRGPMRSFMRSRQTVTAPPPISTVFHRDVIAIDANTRERLEKMVKLARGTLRRFAKAASASAIKTELALLGGSDQGGLLVRLAALDLDGDGHLSNQEFSAFMLETQDLFQGVKDSVMNQSVIAALLLTISAPFLLGPFEVLFPLSWHGDDPVPSAALMALESSTAAWGDAAAFFAPHDATSAARIRRVFFVVEVLLFCLSMFGAAVALKTSKQIYHSLNAMPTTIAKLSYLLRVPRAFAYCVYATDLSLQGLLLGMAFAASRVSLISFVASLGCMAVFWLYQVRVESLLERLSTLFGVRALSPTTRCVPSRLPTAPRVARQGWHRQHRHQHSA